jgi:Methylene-tetrahydromethanopterin dehydrogenase, N-terminal.
MAAKSILHMLSTLKHMSPFDVNMAIDAGFDVAIPYTNVAGRRGDGAGGGRHVLPRALGRPAHRNFLRRP